ncbi:DUF6233 domain-containing protein [Streptomyces sioyaensis]
MDIRAAPSPVAVHAGECAVGGKRLRRITREEASRPWPPGSRRA